MVVEPEDIAPWVRHEPRVFVPPADGEPRTLEGLRGLREVSDVEVQWSPAVLERTRYGVLLSVEGKGPALRRDHGPDRVDLARDREPQRVAVEPQRLLHVAHFEHEVSEVL